MSGLVELRDVFRVYPSAEGGVAALQGLTLTVQRGELCVVLGPSGSGKSTLLRIVSGFDRPSAGSVTVAGVDVARLGPWQAGGFRSRAIGYADQHYWRALAGELTARELVGVQLGLAGVTRERRDARAGELLERVGLGGRRDAHPRELSGGEQQRVALCAAVASRPQLLIADEPTGELDATTAREVLELIAELSRQEGGTALVVSHDPASAERADRVVHVRDGRVSDERVAGGAEGAIVVGRGGWLRLPEELLRSAGIDRHATARLQADALLVEPTRLRVETTPSPSETHRAEGLRVRSTRGIEARGVTKRYGATVPFEGLDASFESGKLTVVTGPSGSGKTTLLHLIAGLELPDEGDVVVDGVSLASLDRAGRAGLRRRSLAFVGQTAGLVPFLGARENAEITLTLRGIPPGEAGERIADALAAVGLDEHAERPVGELSAGQRGRAVLARALAARPLALVADEPTARLDAANALALGALLADVARTSGTTVICATHDPLLIEQADAELSLGST
ncbi:MAG TPA: ATP-binding cassette domain-containing protein [Gaiellaceae bacterium]|nr:ATP-binding cassette domain-containing protein [Gaiellaceae bacterium]